MAKLRDGRAEATRRRPQGAPRRFARAEKSRNPMQIIKSMGLGGDLLQARLRREFAPIEWQEWAMGRPKTVSAVARAEAGRAGTAKLGPCLCASVGGSRTWAIRFCDKSSRLADAPTRRRDRLGV